VSPVLAGWLAVGASILFALVIGPPFKRLILRREDEWRRQNETGPGGTRDRSTTSTGVSTRAGRRS
jgi:hypothetical protein